MPLLSAYQGARRGLPTITLTNLIEYPAPVAVAAWRSNNAVKWVVGYSAGEITVDRAVTADANVGASFYSLGNNAPTFVLPVGVNYQRSVEIWVDAAATIASTGLTGGFATGQVLTANAWTRVVQQFTGTGVTQYPMAISLTMPGVGTGIHVKMRRAQLVANPTGETLEYFDGSTTDIPGAIDYGWTGSVNGSPSTAVIDQSKLALINLCNNPAPTALTGWVNNSATSWTLTYASGEVSIDRLAPAPTNVACSMAAVGINSPVSNPVLTAGVNYQRSVEVWVDAAATVAGQAGSGGPYGFLGGQALTANVWNRVVQQFTGSGFAEYVTGFRVDITGVGTGIHVKLRRAQLVANPTGAALEYFDGASTDIPFTDYGWTGTANSSTSTAVIDQSKDVLVNQCVNPGPASIAYWLPNTAAYNPVTYSNGEILNDRLAAAPSTLVASLYAMGNAHPAPIIAPNTYNPILTPGVNYQRSVEVWVDADAVVGTSTGGFALGQFLPANTWTRVVQQFIGAGVPLYVMGMVVSIPAGAPTGVHCKMRRSQLIVNPSGITQPYFDGATADSPTTDYGWVGAANASNSTAVSNASGRIHSAYRGGYLNATYATTRVNRVPNPAYEVGTYCISSGSTVTYVPSIDTVAPIAGTKSLLMTRADQTITNTIASILGTDQFLTTGGIPQRCPVTAGQPITAGLSVKTDVANASITTRWYWYDTAAALTQGAETTRVASVIAGTVYRVVDTGTPPAGTVTAWFVVTVRAPGAANAVAGQKVWADLLTIEDGTTDGAYFDGSTPSTATDVYSWTGTAHGSSTVWNHYNV